MATDTRVKSTQNLSVGTLNATVVIDLRKNSSFSVQLVPSGSIVGSWTVVVYSSNDGVTVGRSLETLTSATNSMTAVIDSSGFGYAIPKVTSAATSGTMVVHCCAKADRG